MKINITKKHINQGTIKSGQDPLTIAVAEALGLDRSHIYISPTVLTVYGYNLSVNVFTEKLPEHIIEWRKRWYGYHNAMNKRPKPTQFEIGVYEYYPGYSVDVLARIVKKIIDWDGSIEYAENQTEAGSEEL